MVAGERNGEEEVEVEVEVETKKTIKAEIIVEENCILLASLLS